MKFRIDTRLNDGLAEAASMTVVFTDVSELLEAVEEELTGDEGVFIPVGATIELTRLP